MTQEQIRAFNQGISFYQGTDLNELKKLIELKIQEDYDRKENFMLHDKLDDYIYIVHYFDESFHYLCRGKDAYEEFIRDPKAVKISRKTKDLFPTYEDLIEKELCQA